MEGWAIILLPSLGCVTHCGVRSAYVQMLVTTLQT